MERTFTPEEKLAVVERMIEAHRWARSAPGTKEQETWLALRAIASDVRATLPTAPGRTLQALSFQVDSARRSRARIGYLDVSHQQAVAEALLAHWLVVRRALELIERVDKIEEEQGELGDGNDGS